MKKSILAIVIACVCALAALCIVGCGGSPEKSSSSSSEKMEVTKEPSSSKKVIETDPVYILAVGNDSRYMTAEDEGKTIKDTDPSYSDTIMLLRVDPKTDYISVVSIPRDTAVDIDGEPGKINDIHQMKGIQALAEYIEGMFNVKIPYYFDLHFVDFANLINKMGGVTMNVPFDITGGDVITDEDISLSGGENTLNGNEALMLVRQRKIYSDNGEAVRQMLSRELVANAIQSFAKKPASEAAGAADILESFGVTNMPKDVLTAYISAFMNNPNEINFNMGSTPYAGGIDDTGAWRAHADAETCQKIREAMESGSPITDIVSNPAIG